ncbi:hypothetical protein [Nesterenkonia lutea]|uniref:DNA segregation ATPase FtsK/SpoIIIE-like protein n=1 Tax=Nesterenkonia lutea TaxID=272919 RepID=A0ABR9JG10_9MICC|nr:hypothetical protein [Nesterenkonia lutea]MBE1524397.1 DNA segregation ATPase FtsK/SpoIIIE-like protein [Nesterenkonia lutea]
MNHSHQNDHPTEQHQPYSEQSAGAAWQEPVTAEPVDQLKKKRRWPWMVGLFVALFAGVGIGTSGEAEPEVITETETETVTEEVEVEPADLQERRDEITEDEEALEARTAELDDREAALDEREEELASQAQEAAETEEAVQEEEQASSSGSIPGSGTFIVGEDIQPGTYRTDGGSGYCYWARLSGLSGEFGDIITNGLPDGQGFVTIAETDVAFETSDCGEWTAQ